MIVGIWGVHGGAGVTTLTVALANYMQGFLKKKIAVYEYGSKGDFARIYDSIGGKYSVDSECSFSLKNIDYFMKNSTNILSLANDNYDMIIVDFGSGNTALGEFVRCHHKIVMSSLELWNYERYERFCENLKAYSGSDVWLHVLGGDMAEIKRVHRAYGVTAVKRPCIDNAYIIDRTLIEFFQTLFA